MTNHMEHIIGKFDYLDNQGLRALETGVKGKKPSAIGQLRFRIHSLGGSANHYILKKMGLQLHDMLDLI